MEMRWPFLFAGFFVYKALTLMLTLPKFQVAPARPKAARSLADLVGNTPLIRLRHMAAHLPETVEVYAKAEWFNPSGSVKDRPALNIIRTAEANGQLTPDKTLLDSTSGNMGIAYATLARSLGYQIKLAIPANASPERLSILRALGVDFLLTSPLEGSDGAMREARALAAAEPHKFFYANQYDNAANWQAHYFSTGPEIIEQTEGRVTHFVAGLGTSGTLMGTGRALKEFNSEIQLAAIQPDSPFHGLEGLKHMETAIRPGIYDAFLPDEQLPVSTEAAHAMTRRLAREEGLFVGISAGAAAVAALRLAEQLTEGVVVTLFPDAGYKYVSERFWTAD
jgi:cysteine synthase B